MIYILGNLSVYPDHMKRNLEKSGGAIFSERVLLALVNKGVARDTAYHMVQRHALKVGRNGGDLKRELAQDPDIRRFLPAKELEEVWDMKHHLANVDFIFRRVFH
jgi:adenylosuccinate lyase